MHAELIIFVYRVAGNSTNAIVEQIQKDVQELRQCAEKQESQDLPLPSSENQTNAVRARNSAPRLSIASYNLPLRRFLMETESLVQAEFISRRSSYQVNTDADSSVLEDSTSKSVQENLPQVLDHVSEVQQPAPGPDDEAAHDEVSHEPDANMLQREVVSINSIKSNAAVDVPIQIRLNGHAALCKHFNVKEKGINTKFQLWRAFTQDQMGNLLHTEVCSVGPNYSCSRICFFFEHALCVCTFNCSNALPFFKSVIKIDEPEILPFSQYFVTTAIEHKGRYGIKIKWSISSRSNDVLYLWFRSRSTRDGLLNSFQRCLDGRKPNLELTRSLDDSVKEELKDLGWTALSGSI